MHSTPQIDAEVRRLIYTHFLLEAAAVSREEVARQLSLSHEQVAASFVRLAQAHVLALQPDSGELLMASPFSAVPTAFRVRSGGKSWWGNCIWDALGILVMVGRDGSVQTSCPDCGEELLIDVASDRLTSTDAVVHFAVPAARWWEDIVFT
jgi:predicted RNA-binding Zn-ribbon protein involved in translation (DUF1610 family)